MSEIEKLHMIAEWQEQHKQLIEDLDNSKKQIAELEAQIENDRDLPAIAYIQGAEKQKKKDKKQLIKAKELIEKLLNAFASNDFFEEEELEAMAEAEQFIKDSEVEK